MINMMVEWGHGISVSLMKWLIMYEVTSSPPVIK
jgi:hypothetical protein